MLRLHDYRKDSKILRTPGKNLTPDDISTEEFKQNLEDMKTILEIDGVGLAAPQAGWSVNLFILCIDPDDKKIDPKIFINPKIISYSKELVKMEEGCLSFPGLYLSVKRPESIVWEYTDLDWKTHQLESKDFYARAVQHEFDHCQGRVFIDRISPVTKIKVKKWLKAGD
jgi:peptide deformylase